MDLRRPHFCVPHLRFTDSSLAMALLVLNTVMCTSQICQINHKLRKLRKDPAPGLAWSNFSTCGVRRGATNAGRGVNLKWGMNAVASASVDEGIADAKKMIDEVLLSKGSDGAGQLAEVSWALYADGETKKLLADAVTKLSGCRGQDYDDFLRSVEVHGVWEVFYAPHIFTLSSMLVSKIRPLQYVLTESGFESNARYFSPLFGEGWLSASGDYVVRDEKTVDIVFNSFWSDSGRDNLQPDPKNEVCPSSLLPACRCSLQMYVNLAFLLFPWW